MKKLISFLFMFLMIVPTCFSAEWVEIFDKQYIDKDTIEYNQDTQIVKFWVKKYKKKHEKLPSEISNNHKSFDFVVSKWAIDLKNNKSRIESINIYDKKQSLIFDDNQILNWNIIVPGTYAEGYYKIFKSYYKN